MVLESVSCLELHQDELRVDPYASKCPARILTPAATRGLMLGKRLEGCWIRGDGSGGCWYC
jgi:hypothetical protein